MPTWYNDDLESEKSTPRRSYRESNGSVWAESRNARDRRAARQGTAKDARRTIQRHENQSHRTPNRSTVYNTGGVQEDSDMFQAVASGDHLPGRARSESRGFDGINSRGSWHSSNGVDYPALREHHRNDFLKIIIIVVIIILAIAAIILGVQNCSGA